MPETKSRYFYIRSHLNGLVLGAENATESTGLAVLMWPDRAQVNDCHLFYEHHNTGTIRCKTNGNCLQATGKGGRFSLTPYKQGTKEQQWMIEKYYIMNRVDRGYCLDLAGESREPGSRVCSWTLHGKPNQCWFIDYVPPQYFVIKSAKDQRILGLRNPDSAAGSELILTPVLKITPDTQLWWEDRYGIIRAKQDNITPDARGGTVRLSRDDSQSVKQQWIVTGMYITNRHNSDIVLALRDMKDDHDGHVAVIAKKTNRSKLEQWTFLYV